MTTKEIKRKVREFKKKFNLHECTYNNLKAISRKQGFTVIEYNHVCNDEAVQTIINNLNLSDNVIHSKGFTCADKNYRLIFIHEDLNEEEKTIILAHENAHIFLEHFSSVSVIGNDVREEYDANEFTHYLLNKSAASTIANFISRKKVLFICIAAALIVSISALIIINAVATENSYYGDFYLTNTGNKYHEKECKYVKNKDNIRRLTEEEFSSGNYSPCLSCLPNDSDAE